MYLHPGASVDAAIAEASAACQAILKSRVAGLISNVPLLEKMLPTVSKLQNTKIVVAGYIDNVPIGAELKTKGVSNNLDLSAERAVGIANYLASHGVKADLISAHAFGETDPVASNDTPEGQAKNRRVDILLTGDGK